MAITIDQAVEALLVSAPHLRERWERQWGSAGVVDARAKADPAMWLAWFAGFVAEDIERERAGHMPAFGLAVEDLLARGDEMVRDAVRFGLLEGLVNHALSKALELDTSWFGPTTVKHLREVDAFWGTRTPGLWGRGGQSPGR